MKIITFLNDSLLCFKNKEYLIRLTLGLEYCCTRDIFSVEVICARIKQNGAKFILGKLGMVIKKWFFGSIEEC